MTSMGWNPSLRGTSADIAVLRTAIRPFLKHRWIAYLMLTVLMTSAMVFGGGEFANAGSNDPVASVSATAYGSSPVRTETGYATLSDTASPADVSKQISGASSLEALNFLAFSRWHGANNIPSPNVTIGNVPAMLSAGMASIGGMLMTVASTIVWLMGILLSLAISTNLMSNLANTIDHSFAIMGTNILASGAFISLMSFILVGVTIMNILRGQRRRAFLGFIGGVFALLALMGMTSQASSNHTDTLNGRTASNIAAGESASKPSSGTGIIQYKGDPFEKPNDWAAWSPGWIMAQSNYLLKGASGAVVGGINSVSNAIGSVGVATDKNSMCGRYIDSMYTLYDSVKAVKNNPSMQVLKSYDLLTRAVYFNTYATAAYGNSDSARNVWCRMAEANSHQTAGEQALIARKAGIYTEAVGVEGKDHGNAFVDKNGAWRDPGNGLLYPDQSGKLLASDFFGTASYNLTSNTRMLYYFAACYWPDKNGSAKILPSWKGVIEANSGKVDSIWSVGNVFDIFGDMTGQNGLDDSSCSLDPMNSRFGFGLKDNVTNTDANTKGGRQFDYSINPTDLIYTITGGVVTPYDRHFMWPVAQGNDAVIQAQSFYRITQGSNAAGSIIFGLVPLILVIMMAKYILPLILGAFIAQVICTVLLILLPLTIIAWMVPLDQTRKWLGLTGLTTLYSFMVTLLFLAVTTITLMVIHVLMWVLAPLATGGATLSATGMNGSILLMIQVGLAVFIGLKTVKVILTKAFAIDMSSLKNATVSAGLLSGGAILSQLGMDRPQVFNAPNDILSDDTKRKYEELRGRINSRRDQKPGSTDDFLNDKSGPGKGKGKDGGLSSEGAQNGLGGATSDSDLADVAATGAGVIGAATAAAQAANGGSPEPQFTNAGTTLADMPNPIQNASYVAGSGEAPVAGSGAGSVVPNESDIRLSPTQKNQLSNQVAEMSDNLLGGAAPQSLADAISQPGNAGDFAALGTNQAAVDRAIASQSIDAMSTDGGSSPYRDSGSARGNFDDLIAKQDAIRSSLRYADPRPLAEQVLSGSAYADSPVGVDANGIPLGLSIPNRDSDESRVDDWLYSPMALFDPSFDSEMNNRALSLGPEPRSVFTWEDQSFRLSDIASASSAAMASASTGISSAAESIHSAVASLGNQFGDVQEHRLMVERFLNVDGIQVRTEAMGDAAQAIIDEFATREAAGEIIDPNMDRFAIIPQETSQQVLRAIGAAAHSTGRMVRNTADVSKWFFDTL